MPIPRPGGLLLRLLACAFAHSARRVAAATGAGLCGPINLAAWLSPGGSSSMAGALAPVSIICGPRDRTRSPRALNAGAPVAGLIGY